MSRTVVARTLFGDFYETKFSCCRIGVQYGRVYEREYPTIC